MPVPNPKSNESERDYISRCEKFMHEENNSKPEGEKRSNDQITAICYSTWRKKQNLKPASKA
jgi:hypothetical protein